jgi:sulfopyruvate decarboxylase TPP-binding subunit
MQYTGLLDSINAIRAVAVEYSLPICMMAGLLQKEPGVLPRDSKQFGVRIAGPVLDALGVKHHVIETDADVGLIRPAIEAAYTHQHPVVLFIGGRPVS